LLLCQLLHIGDVHGVDADGAVLGLGHAVEVHPLLAHRLHMRGPRVDQSDVVAERGQVRADVAADRAGADEGDAFGHFRFLSCSPVIARSEATKQSPSSCARKS
jgi:hypothetical protein